MTFSDRESSEYDGRPIEIYTLYRGGNVWRYTSADEDQLVGGQVFTALPIQRSNIEQTQEMARNNITISMVKDCPFLLQFRGSPPTSVINVTVQRFHEGLQEFITMWLGRVVNVKFAERQAEVRCEPIYTSLRRPVLRMRYQTTCPHVLYGNGCKVIRADYAVNGTLLSDGGTLINIGAVSTYADGFFAGGYVDWENNGDTQRRFILSHTGQQLQINLPFAGILGGASMVIYPGCDHLLTTCHTKFANEDNYGGQPFYAGKNPMNGSNVF